MESEYAFAIVRIIAEEMRHGWQMCYLLVRYFGDTARPRHASCWSAGPAERTAARRL